MKLMYQRLRRKSATAWLPETQDYVARLAANGGVIANTSMNYADEFVRDLYEAGLWHKIVEAGLFLGGNLAAALVKLKYLPGTPGVLVNNNFVAGDYVETGSTGGLLGNGSTKALRTGLSPQLLGAAVHLSFYLREDLLDGEYRTLMGVATATDDFALLQAASLVQCRYQQSVSASAALLTKGFWCGVREQANSISLYKDGLLKNTSSTAVTPATSALDFALFGQNNNGAIGNFLNRRGSFYSLGQPLSAAEQAELHLAVKTLQQNLNRAV